MQGDSADGVCEADLRGIGLNESQSKAVACALTMQHGVRLIQGPPGTGKTEMLALLLELALEKRHRSTVSTLTRCRKQLAPADCSRPAAQPLCEGMQCLRTRIIESGTSKAADRFT